MASIKKLQENIDSLSNLVSKYDSQLVENKENHAVKLTLDNIKSQIEELQKELYYENIKREKEIVKLRFIGQFARFGTLPLELVGNITNSFFKAIFNSSKYFQYGNKGGARIDKLITQTIDLRLEGIGRGSTIFYLSAKTSPDLFGNSIIQGSLENTFGLLNSETVDQTLDSISKLGSRSIKYYSNFIKELTQDDLELELSWHTPTETVKIWEGKKQQMLTLYNTLNSIKFLEPEEIDFEGEIITLSLKGKFEILTWDKERIFGTFPINLLDEIKQLHIGDSCSGTILKTTFQNPVTGKNRYEYLLSKFK
jgi:hypothetical protein